jgi:hypothetical protein
MGDSAQLAPAFVHWLNQRVLQRAPPHTRVTLDVAPFKTSLAEHQAVCITSLTPVVWEQGRVLNACCWLMLPVEGGAQEA